MEHWWNVNDRGKLKYLNKKPVPVPLCLPGIPHELKWHGILVILCSCFQQVAVRDSDFKKVRLFHW